MTRKEELKYIKKGKRLEKIEGFILLFLGYVVPFFIWFMK